MSGKGLKWEYLNLLSWNNNGLKSKLNDFDFLNFISSYDIVLLTETWTSKFSNLKIKNFEYFHGPRPNSKRKAKRSSGGIVIYYKDSFVNKIELVNINPKGIIWIKFKKEHFGCEKDIYLCTCYIPPEDSNVYKDVNSTLFEFDFFEQLNEDIRNYSNLGKILNVHSVERNEHFLSLKGLKTLWQRKKLLLQEQFLPLSQCFQM